MTINLETTQLRPHQIEDIKFLLDRNLRAILANKAGLGKSLSILTALFVHKPFPVLIIVNKPGLSVWSNELHKWFNEPSVVITGTPKQRTKALQFFITHQVNFLITNYAFYQEVLAKTTPMFFKSLILDEYHLPGLLNRKTKIYKFTKSIAKLIPHIILMTGTPMRQTPADWYAPLSIIAPDDFKSYWNFVYDFCVVIKDKYGLVIERIPQNEANFREMLSHYRRRYTDKSHLPPKTRQPIPVEMTPKQKKLFDQLRKEMYLEEDGHFVITSNKLSMTLRCRQLMVCPEILGFNDKGGAIELMKDLVIEELSEGNSIVIFTPFRKAIKPIRTELEKIKPQPDIFEIHGDMTHEEHQQVQREFQNSATKNKVVICTIKSGVSITLTEASTAVFVGYELSVNDNTQAEDRLAREGQRKNVRCYYLLYKDNAVDGRGIELLNDKSKALAIDVSVNDYYRGLVNVRD